MIIICPKFSYYSALSSEVKSSVRATMKKTVAEYVKGRPTVLLEDTFAKSLFGDMSDVISITDPRDYSQMVAFDYYEQESCMKEFYNMYPHDVCPFVKFENPPVAMAFKNRAEFVLKRTVAYEKRLSESVKYLAANHKAVLTFVGNTNSKSKLSIKPEEDDGILNIMYNLDTNTVNCYYSGVWVDVDMAKQILGGLYG